MEALRLIEYHPDARIFRCCGEDKLLLSPEIAPFWPMLRTPKVSNILLHKLLREGKETVP